MQGNRITGHLQVSDFRFKFQQGNALLRSAVTHLKQDGRRRISGVISWICLRSFTCHWRFRSRQIVTMNLVTLFTQHNGVLQAFNSRDRRLQAYQRRLRN